MNTEKEDALYDWAGYSMVNNNGEISYHFHVSSQETTPLWLKMPNDGAVLTQSYFIPLPPRTTKSEAMEYLMGKMNDPQAIVMLKKKLKSFRRRNGLTNNEISDKSEKLKAFREALRS